MKNNKFVIMDTAEVIVTERETGKVKYKTEVKAKNFNKETDDVVTFDNGKYETTMGFNKENKDFQKFIDAWNDIGCMSFSREALGEERWNKIIEESENIRADRVGLGIKFIKAFNEDMTADDVVTHLKVYKNGELYVEVTDYSPYANKDYMSKSLRKALKGGKTLTYEQNKELIKFKVSKVLYI